ncbi:MAG: hypothetical protein HKN87_18525 [Saprospiraceae bacterium]|nr:hypothetical protein [Saprospiraceae bacterium]
MSELIRFAEQSIGALLVGKRVLDSKFEIARYVLLREVSQLMSSVVSFVLFGIGVFMAALLFLIGLGMWASEYYNVSYLLVLVPASILTIGMFVLWVGRERVFESIARQFLKNRIE